MRIITSLLGEKRETTLDALLDTDMHCLFQYRVVNEKHRDFLKGYALVKGVDLNVIDAHFYGPVPSVVTITFLDL